ncbi:unnamed protein product [Trichobilharzia szidati]|nr:unnamed protein product [Trichobilharzia szidati]
MPKSYESHNEESNWLSNSRINISCGQNSDNVKRALDHCNNYVRSCHSNCSTCHCGGLLMRNPYQYETNPACITSKLQEQEDAYRGYIDLFRKDCLCEVTRTTRLAPIPPYCSMQQTKCSLNHCQPVCCLDLSTSHSGCSGYQQDPVCRSCTNTLMCQNTFQPSMVISPPTFCYNACPCLQMVNNVCPAHISHN